MDLTKTLFNELGLENIDTEEKEKILEQTADIVLERVLLRLMNELEEEDAKDLNELLEKGKDEEVATILYEKFPNIDEIFNEEINKFKQELKHGK
ncbi:MAG: DUF5663 domain-containing protein [Candidatus Paceibacterota bacterium]